MVGSSRLTKPKLARMLGAAALCLVAVVTPLGVAAASPSAGTFTKITTPSKDVLFNFKVGGVNTLHVSGQTSLDVTTVDIMCVASIVNGPPQAVTMAATVPVSSGQFSTGASFPSNVPISCRLRAIPQGTDLEAGDYIGAYSGPIIRPSAFGLTQDGSSTTYSYFAQAAEGDGISVLSDAGSCAVEALVTVEAPQMLAGPVLFACGFTLAPQNITASGTSNASEIQVSGHNAYLPSGVYQYLNQDLGLGVTQTALDVHRKLSPNGDVTITESAPLVRCSGSDTYPPTDVSCPSLVPTGVTFIRSSTTFRNGHQVKVRDAFISTDHQAHPLDLQYLSSIENQTSGGTATGRIGYIFPGHGSTFTAQSLGSQISGLGSRIGTFYTRSDLYAGSDDTQADTQAATWSRAPSQIRYDGAHHDEFGMAYALRVPADGAANLGFAMSERWQTADLPPLVSAASQDMLPGVSITSPHAGSKTHGKTTVKGHLKAGANGLPVSVKVNGHKAKIHKTSLSAATYKVKLKVPHTKHAITAVAKDAAGNTAKKSIKVNKT